MNKRKIKFTVIRELKENEFICNKCNKINEKSLYAIAQGTMGVTLIFTCECGNKIDIKPLSKNIRRLA